MKRLVVFIMVIMTLHVADAREIGSLFGIVTDRETGAPIPYANVIIVGTKMGGMTLTDGTFVINAVPAGVYTIKAMMMSYRPVEIHGVVVEAGITTRVDFQLEVTIVAKTQEIVVEAELPQILVTESDVSHRLSENEIHKLPVDDVVEALALKSGIVKTGDQLHVRGGRSGAAVFQIDGTPAHDPFAPSTPSIDTEDVIAACTYPRKNARLAALSHMMRSYHPSLRAYYHHNTEEYEAIDENRFLEALETPLSTFSIDVDAASYAIARRFMEENYLPPRDAVRIEEFINYFAYSYPEPVDDVPFSIHIEYSGCPWNGKHNLVLIGLKGKKPPVEERVPSNLVFLIDVSGSMEPPDKLPLLKRSYLLLTDRLKDNDIVSIVVYSDVASLHLRATSGSDREKIRKAILALCAGGSTAGANGLSLAYKVASETFIHGGNNRVVLATDGDFNIGVSSTSELVRLIEKKREDGIFLSILGFGSGNYKDHRLESIADRGNGNYNYIDDILEAHRVLVEELGATLYTIAKDVKIQVEFNPAMIGSYRLIGYENRKLPKEDFTDDVKDAGEIGAGHTVTALYEVVPVDNDAVRTVYELNYQETRIKRSAGNSGEILTVSVRYKEPDGDESKLITTELCGSPVSLKKASDDFRFSAAVAMFAMILRDSRYTGEATFKKAFDLAKSAKGDDPYERRSEFVRLVKRAKVLRKLDK